MEKIKNQQYKKLELLQSLNDIEQNIEDMLKKLSTANLENTIFDLYTPTNKFRTMSKLTQKKS